MKAYLSELNNGISQRIADWHLAGGGRGGTCDLRFYPAIKQLTLDLAAATFLGIELGPQANTVNRAFVDMVAAITSVVRTPIPGTQMWKGVKGREAIVAFFCREIPKRRAGQATDPLGAPLLVGDPIRHLVAGRSVVDFIEFDGLATGVASNIERFEELYPP
jgi:cytochrome P450